MVYAAGETGSRSSLGVSHRTCLLSDTSCVSSCLRVSTPESWDADRAVMSPCSRCMPLGGLRRARSGWWRYCAPMFSFFTGPERLGVALSAPVVLLGFCFTACGVGTQTQVQTRSRSLGRGRDQTCRSRLSWRRSRSRCRCLDRPPPCRRCWEEKENPLVTNSRP